MFARQALNHLSQASSPVPLGSGYFSDKMSLFFQACLNWDPPILNFPL
jgi:hypothetical protein